MKKDDVQDLSFIIFVFAAGIALVSNNPAFTTTAMVSGVVLGTLLVVDYLK